MKKYFGYNAAGQAEYILNFAGLISDDAHAHVSEDVKISMQNYFLYGLEPGSFVYTMLCNDLFSAVYCADIASRKSIWGMAKWVVESAPMGSYGSKLLVQQWCQNTHNIRSNWSDAVIISWEKQKTWETLGAVAP
jgi:hypothetical protein